MISTTPILIKSNNFQTTRLTPKQQTINSSAVLAQKDDNKAIAFYGQDLVKQKELPLVLTNMLTAIKGHSNEELAEIAYPYLVKYLGVEDIAPKNITWEQTKGRTTPIVADYKVSTNAIVLYKDYFKKSSKLEQIAFIAHELTHCKQAMNIMRTEGLGIERYAYAQAVSDFRASLVLNENLKKAMANAKAKGKEKELAQFIVKQSTQNNIKELKTTYPNLDKLGKIDINSPEGQKAQKDLSAQFYYNGADPISCNINPLEVEAYQTEKELIRLLKNEL